MDIKEIFKDNGILKKKNKNYKKRVSQIKAAILLEKAIKDKNPDLAYEKMKDHMDIIRKSYIKIKLKEDC